MKITAYIADWCSDSNRSTRLLKSLGLEYEEVDIEMIAGAEVTMKSLNGGSGKIPTIVVEREGEKHVLVEPRDEELKLALGIA